MLCFIQRPPDYSIIEKAFHFQISAIRRLFLTKDNSFKNYITSSLRQLDTFRYLTTICSKILFFRNIPLDNIAVMLKITSESQTCRLEPSPQKDASMAIIFIITIWLLVGFHPATRSVQSTPANNTRKQGSGSI